MPRLVISVERFPILGNFVISRGAKTEAAVVVAAMEDGRLDSGLLARSRARIESLLARVPTNEVAFLPESVFGAHATTAVLYDAATVEVV